ncbi:hypothetical protein [Aquimarina algiphila]|uniref:hypothetical protein n=1 Tax=Aquimarina algiphila TaxID=2047982 RepID=UPI00232FBC75|nr:hypothetical protein [Aquimarina algiphila]
MSKEKRPKTTLMESNELPFGDWIVSNHNTLISRDDFLKQLEIQIHQDQWK